VSPRSELNVGEHGGADHRQLVCFELNRLLSDLLREPPVGNAPNVVLERTGNALHILKTDVFLGRKHFPERVRLGSKRGEFIERQSKFFTKQLWTIPAIRSQRNRRSEEVRSGGVEMRDQQHDALIRDGSVIVSQ